MAETVIDTDFDSKYGHLTKPLKEAALCWDIDLGEVIESFLTKENEDIHSLDPSHMLNFAQAGMLVSSTTANYSRKVEHLYTLVYSTLDSLSKGEGKSLVTSALMKKMRKRIVGFQEFENGFELLDSQFEQPGKGIDMPAGGGISNGSHITRRVPLLLLPREDSNEKTAKDPSATQSKQSSNGTDYKSSSCWISESGCLLLDPSFAVYEEADRISAGGRGSMGGRASLSGPLIPGAVPQTFAPAIAGSPPISQTEVPPIADDFRKGGPPSPIFEPAAEEFLDIPELSPEEDDGPVADDSPVGLYPPLTPAKPALGKRTRLDAVEAPPPVDVWKELDPHSIAVGGRNIKMKVGKCHKTPADLLTIMELGSMMDAADCYQSRSDLFAVSSELLADSSGDKKGDATKGASRMLPVSLPVLSYFKSELSMELADMKKRAAAAAREKRNAERRAQNEETEEDEESEAEEVRHASDRFSIASRRSSFGSSKDIEAPLAHATGPISLVPVRSREDTNLQAERERTALLEKVLESSKRDYDEFVRKHLQDMAANGHVEEARAGPASTLPVGATAASVVVAAGNSMRDRIPELYANIRKWQDNLEPLLEEQNARPLFDLDDYLVSILDKLKTAAPQVEDREAITDFLKNVVGMDEVDEDADPSPTNRGPVSSFEDLVRGEPKWNVCRLFLSTLILTNNGNVEIFGSTVNGDLPMDEDASPRSLISPARHGRTPVGKTPAHREGGTPLRGSHTYGAGQSFQVKLRNADKNLKFAVEDNAGVVSGIIPIITNKDVPAPEPIGDVPFGEDDE